MSSTQQVIDDLEKFISDLESELRMARFDISFYRNRLTELQKSYGQLFIKVLSLENELRQIERKGNDIY